MSAYFTKDELRELFKEFLFIIGNDIPEGHIKPAWKRFCEIKQNEMWRADLEALAEEGFIERVYDPSEEEWGYTLTAKGAASRKRGELERLRFRPRGFREATMTDARSWWKARPLGRK